jgi:hypothetical protein
MFIPKTVEDSVMITLFWPVAVTNEVQPVARPRVRRVNRSNTLVVVEVEGGTTGVAFN